MFEQGFDIPNRIEEADSFRVDNFLPYINIINVFTIQDNKIKSMFGRIFTTFKPEY